MAEMSDKVCGLPEGWVLTTIGEITQPIEKIDPGMWPEREFMYLDISSIDNTLNVVTEPKLYRGIDAPSRARQQVHTRPYRDLRVS